MNIIVIIPALNEEQSIGSVLHELRKRYQNIIVVDDGSDDRTSEISEKAGVTVLRHLINRGQGASLKTGITKALDLGADIIVTFDADGQHSIDDIDNLITPIINNKCEVVLGSRFLENTAVNMPKFRRFILKSAVIFTQVVSRVKISDVHNGLRAFSRMAASKFRLRQDRMAHASEILDEIHRHKLSYIEVPVTISYTDYSTSKGQSSMAFGKILVKYLLGRILR